MGDRFPAQITLYVKTGGNPELEAALKTNVDLEPFFEDEDFLRVLREGGKLTLQESEASGGEPFGLNAFTDNAVNGVLDLPNVDWDYQCDAKYEYDGVAKWRREGSVSEFTGSQNGTPLVSAAELVRMAEQGWTIQEAAAALAKPAPSYKVGPQEFETGWG